MSLDPKDPNDTDDFFIDWTSRLEGDTIVTSTWIVPAGITKITDVATDSVCRIRLSGGSDGNLYRLTNRITTAGGRTLDQSIRIRVLEK